ncbi:unnamed protein product [Prunus armeniaca]
MENLSKQHWNAVKWIFRYLKGTKKLGILFERQQRKAYAMGYVDSDYAGDIDKRRSNMGSKHIDIRYHWIRDWVNDEDIAIEKIEVELLGITTTVSKRKRAVQQVEDLLNGLWSSSGNYKLSSGRDKVFVQAKVLERLLEQQNSYSNRCKHSSYEVALN